VASSTLLRLSASPIFNARAIDDLARRLNSAGKVLLAVSDADLSTSIVSAAIHGATASDVVRLLGSALRPFSAGRAFRIEFLSDAPAELPNDDDVRDMARFLESTLPAAVYSQRRTGSVQQWAQQQPYPWGHRGPIIDKAAPAGESECLGVALAFGSPTILYKVRLRNMPDDGLKAACRAVGGPGAGFSDVAAYPATSAADGCAVAILELAERSRTPLPRVLDVIAIECERYGARLDKAALLSHVPLELLLDVLRARTGLEATTSQIIETHLP
jgi:hypothetical protein